jgi:ABC-2 type transport system permease protein
MNNQVNAMHEFEGESRSAVAPAISPSRRFYWSICRELWENRSLYVAPLTIAAVALIAFSLSSIVGIWETPLSLDPAKPLGPYNLAAGLMMLTGIVVSIFYCADALHGERRDRSILFWKSLPVSDTTTVLAKACIPLVVLPLLIFAIAFALQWLMLLVSSAVLFVSGKSVAELWRNLSFLRMNWLLLYHLVTAHALWPLPVYCWLLLVSGWARRATFLWAVLPVIAIGGVERLVFGTWHFAALVGSRLIGNLATGAATSRDAFPTDPMTHIHPSYFMGNPALWLGFVIAAVFLFAAIRLRHSQGPI